MQTTEKRFQELDPTENFFRLRGTTSRHQSKAIQENQILLVFISTFVLQFFMLSRVVFMAPSL